jgi:hypothetical protein
MPIRVANSPLSSQSLPFPNLAMMIEEKDIADIKQLYPGISDAEATEAADRFYLLANAMLQISKNIESDSERLRSFQELTSKYPDGTLGSYWSSIARFNTLSTICNDVSPTSESPPLNKARSLCRSNGE